MSEKKKSVFGFDAMEIAATTEKQQTEPENKKGIGKSNSETEQTDGLGNGTTEPKHTDGSGNGFIEQFKEKTTRKKVEETHRRQTYLINKELIKRLDRLARRESKGFKTALVNEGIRRLLNEVEGQDKKG